jgi:hypothetical protein
MCNNNNNNGYSALGLVWQEPEPSQATGMALILCIPGKFLRVTCHCFPLPLDVPTFAARCLHILNDARDPSSERWNYGRGMSGNFGYMMSLFTALGIFYMPQIYDMGPKALLPLWRKACLKIRLHRPDLNPRTWVLKASTLPLDHRNQKITCIEKKPE